MLHQGVAEKQDGGNEPGRGPLRQGGIAPPDGGITTDNNLPSTRSAASRVQMPSVRLARDLWAGPERVASEGQVYLPKNQGEDQVNYDNRLKRSVFVNFFRRTVEGLVGLIFAADPVLGDDVPPQIVELWENIDLEGTHGDVFVRESLTDAMTVGHAAILVEFPQVSDAALADGSASRMEAEGELRPYWVPILKENILSWRTMKLQGRKILTQVVIQEIHMIPDGNFGEKRGLRYRVFFRRSPEAAEADTENQSTVGFQLFVVTDDKKVIMIDSGFYPTQTEIPIVEVPTSGEVDLFVSQPPLLDLLWLNIAHYQQWSDYAWTIHKTSGFVFIAGVETEGSSGNPAPLEIGSNAAVVATNPNAKAQYVEHSGQALGASKAALDDLKSDMGTLGITMLAPQKRVAETAEAKRIDKSTSDSTLGVTARSDQDAIEQALKFTANYMGLPEGGSITINRDFDQLSMDPSVMAAYAALIAQGFPLAVALEMLQRGKRVPDDEDIDELEMEMLAGEMAQADQRRIDAEAQVAEAASDG